MQDNKGKMIRLIIGGYESTYWDNVIIDSQIDIPADAWSLTLFNPEKGYLPNDLKSGALTKIYYGNELILTGILDRIVQTINRTGRTLALSGRDLVGQLIDCSVPIKNSRQLTLSTLLEEYVLADFSHLFQDIRVQDDKWLKNKVTVEPSESIYDAIAKAAQVTGQYVWFDSNSAELRIGDPFKFTDHPVETLILMEAGENNNILEARYEEDVSNVFNEIKILSQDEKGRGISAETKADTQYKFNRLKIVTLSDIESQSEAYATLDKIKHDNDLEAYTLFITVPDWTINGTVWGTGWQINLKSDVIGRANANWVVLGRTLKLSRKDGKTTELKLKRKGDWAQPLIYKDVSSLNQKSKSTSKKQLIDAEERSFLEKMNG